MAVLPRVFIVCWDQPAHPAASFWTDYFLFPSPREREREREREIALNPVTTSLLPLAAPHTRRNSPPPKLPGENIVVEGDRTGAVVPTRPFSRGERVRVGGPRPRRRPDHRLARRLQPPGGDRCPAGGRRGRGERRHEPDGRPFCVYDVMEDTNVPRRFLKAWTQAGCCSKGRSL